MFSSWSRVQKWGAALGLLVVVVVVIVLAVVLTRGGSSAATESLGAVATDGSPCQTVALGLLEAGGSAADMIIGALLCEGVASAQSMGLGGGFLMTIYNRTSREAFVLDARETAPAAASENMYNGNETLATTGGLAVAVPAELAGYWALHQKFGRLAWADIIKPVIKICDEGIPVNNYVASNIQSNKAAILASETLRSILSNETTGELLRIGDVMRRPALARTLEVVAKEGGRAMHGGSLTRSFVQDIQNFGGIVTEEDMANYQPRWESPTRASLRGGLELLSTPPPGSGPLLAHFLQITAGYVTAPLDAHQYHRIVEAMKFVYAARTRLGDAYFVESAAAFAEQLVNQTYSDEIRSKIIENVTSTDPTFYGANFSTSVQRGTAHVAVIRQDMAVSVTSTVNTLYGSKLVSPSTGIILNNEMDDFSLPGVSSSYGVPPSESNFIVPGKRPQSSMAPSIVIDSNGDVVLVIGASGGPRITSAIGLVALKHLYLGMDLSDAVVDKRIHHQLMPMVLQLETGFSEDLANELLKYGHTESALSTTASSVMAIAVSGNQFTPIADLRREGVSGVL